MTKSNKSKSGATGKTKSRATDKTKSKAKSAAKPKTSQTRKSDADELDIKQVARQLQNLEKKLDKMSGKIDELNSINRENVKKIGSIENRLETRVKREEVLMSALGLGSRSKKGDKGKVIKEFNSSLLKTEEYLLHTGKRIDNLLSAVKNHREYLVKLNKRVYKVDAKERIVMELDVMSNTLSILMLSGFDFDKSLVNDIDRVKKQMEKKDAELTNIKKRMARLDRKFEEEMERFDFQSIYSKKKDIPGYR